MFTVAVLRGVNPTVPIGGSSVEAIGSGTTSTAPAVTLSNNDGTSQLLHFHGFGDAVNLVGTINAAPAGYTQNVAAKPSTLLGSVLNTKNNTTTDGAVAQTVSGNVWRSGASVEILAPGVTATDGVHQTSATGLFTTSTSNYLASSGADVFVALSTAVSSAHTLNSITYNGVAMTLVAGPMSHSPTINSYLGYTWLYRAAGAGTGAAAPLVITFSTNVWCCVDVFSYVDVASIGTPITNYGDSTAPSTGALTLNSGERMLSVIGGGSTRVAGISAPTGGNNRALIQTSTAYASLAVNDSGLSPTTFGATFSTAQLWSSIAVPLRSRPSSSISATLHATAGTTGTASKNARTDATRAVTATLTASAKVTSSFQTAVRPDFSSIGTQVITGNGTTSIPHLHTITGNALIVVIHYQGYYEIGRAHV
jgi:hypothetical protein